MLDKLEFIREASSEPHLVLSASVVGTDFLRDQPLVVLVYGDTLYQTINLLAFGVDIDFAFLEEDCLLAVGATVSEFFSIHIQLG